MFELVRGSQGSSDGRLSDNSVPFLGYADLHMLMRAFYSNIITLHVATMIGLGLGLAGS